MIIVIMKILHHILRLLSYNPLVPSKKRNSVSQSELAREQREQHYLRHELHRIEHWLEQIIRLLTAHPPATAITRIFTESGAINMPQTSLKSFPGSDTLSFQTFDSSTPPVDITSRCRYSVTSDGPAVSVGPVSGSSVSVSYSEGSANLTITTSDPNGDTIPAVVLAAVISPAPVVSATTTVTASNPNTTIS